MSKCTCGKDLNFIHYCYRQGGIKDALLAILFLPLIWPFLLLPDRHAPDCGQV